MEIEAKMREDKEQEEKRLAKEESSIVQAGKKVVQVKKTGTNGVVKKPVVKRFGRGF
jgi:hypothetical protein